MTEDGRGRGLYATGEKRVGQLFLVSNAVAYESAFTTAFHGDNRRKANMVSPKGLFVAVACAARKPQRFLCQLYSLLDSPVPGKLDVPAIDLFNMDGQMSEGRVPNENLQVDFNHIRHIIGVNSFGGASVSQQELKFIGL